MKMQIHFLTVGGTYGNAEIIQLLYINQLCVTFHFCHEEERKSNNVFRLLNLCVHYSVYQITPNSLSKDLFSKESYCEPSRSFM